MDTSVPSTHERTELVNKRDHDGDEMILLEMKYTRDNETEASRLKRAAPNTQLRETETSKERTT